MHSHGQALCKSGHMNKAETKQSTAATTTSLLSMTDKCKQAYLAALQDALEVHLFQEGVHRQLGAPLIL